MTLNSAYDNLSFNFDAFRDERGTLTIASITGDSHLPFSVQRVFWITDVPGAGRRGMHAHHSCWEALVAVKGSFKVKVTDGKNVPRTFVLDTPQKGLLIPPMMWCELFDFSDDAVCLCLASGDYDKQGYISNYQDFLLQVK